MAQGTRTSLNIALVAMVNYTAESPFNSSQFQCPQSHTYHNKTIPQNQVKEHNFIISLMGINSAEFQIITYWCHITETVFDILVIAFFPAYYLYDTEF